MYEEKTEMLAKRDCVSIHGLLSRFSYESLRMGNKANTVSYRDGNLRKFYLTLGAMFAPTQGAHEKEAMGKEKSHRVSRTILVSLP